jgi:eukaryotic-like serine/threonine-protein kinase
MGEVYRATDTRLKRDVALKILPESFATDADRLARFQREAEVLASLNHPNIAAIYGIEESQGTRALVMELVEGPTLADRIAQGPIPVDEALPIARQIAEALEAAHEQGIIHRDLKPANIKVRPDGTVKVLDFGLAKALEPAGAMSPSATASPTITSPAMMTGVGVLLGTAAYMSPEQARGKVVDKRSDIWAFGCVLYEMLTGRSAFQGEDIGDILASVVKTEPDWGPLPDSTPTNIRLVLRRCLRKDRRQRLADAGAVRLEIEEALTAPGPAPDRQSQGRRTISAALACSIAVVAAAIGVGIGTWFHGPAVPTESMPVARVTLPLSVGTELGGGQSVSISPNGTHVAYVASRGGGIPQIYIRPMNGVDARLFGGTEGAAAPFFSPDGEWLAFFADGKLKKVSTTGGVVTVLADAEPQGGSWGADDKIVFRSRGELVQISSAGGPTRRFSSENDNGGEASPRAASFPELLPGGTAVVFTSGGEDTIDERSIEVLRIDTGERKVLIQGGYRASYLPTGHLVFLRSGTVMAVPFDLDRLELSGEPVRVIEGVRQLFNGGAFSCSRTGTCIYVAGGLITQRTVAFIDRAGASQPLPLAPQSYTHPRFSPAGDKVVFWIEQSRCDLAVYDIARGVLTRITSDGDNHWPVWTPDGREITYASRKALPPAGYELFSRAADGSSAEERVSEVPQNLNALSALAWTRDGESLAFVLQGDIWLLPRRGEQKAQPILQSRFNETMPAFSPDGHWLAYVSDESGQQEVYLQPFPELGAKYRISTNGGTDPVWARSGRELFFRNSDQMMVVDVGTQPGLISATPRVLFSHSFAQAASRTSYDVSPDGRRFIVIEAGETESPARQINVVLNWFEELKRLVPTN